MKLYYAPGACSLAAHIVLEEAGRPYTTEAVNLKSKQTATGQDYTAINPKGYVPALVLDSGEVLTEVPAIVQYLADQVPEKKLAPAVGDMDRYRMQSWLNFTGTELHRSFGAFFNPAASDEWKAYCRANLQRRLSYVNDQLAGCDFLLGQVHPARPVRVEPPGGVPGARRGASGGAGGPQGRRQGLSVGRR